MTSLAKVPTDLFIGGAWMPSTSAGTFDVLDPASDDRLARVADATPDDAAAAVTSAARAQAAWARTPHRRRSEVLRSAYELLTAREQDLALLITRENGKALDDARGEVRYAAEFLRWFSEEAVRVPGRLAEAPDGENTILVAHRPIGVCVLVTPWNFPAAMITRKIAPALAAGCTVVLKPAEDTPLTALALAELFAAAGVPGGVINVVPTSSPGPVVSAMLADERVRMLSFTGSTAIGKLLLRQAADRVLKCAMELGGNAPFIVCDDADLDAALDGAMLAKMRNGGQACTAANRFYVHESAYPTFARRLAERMSEIVVGDGARPGVGCGPLINQTAAAKVDRLVTSALARGARALTSAGNVPPSGTFYPPTVLVDVPADAEILTEEIFGPVAAVVPFADDEAVVELANATPAGLVAYLYTGDAGRGMRLASELECGMVALNRGLVSEASAPFGGMKQSGLGREGSEEGILEYLEPQYIAAQW